MHAFLWQNGKMTDLGTLGGRSSNPRAINERGQVVGESFTASGTVHAFLWQTRKDDRPRHARRGIEQRGRDQRPRPGRRVERSRRTARSTPSSGRRGKMTDLGTLGPAYSDSGAVAINDRGQIIGDSYKPLVTQTGQHGHAFLWQNGTMNDLGTLGRGYPAAARSRSTTAVRSSARATTGTGATTPSCGRTARRPRSPRLAAAATRSSSGSMTAAGSSGAAFRQRRDRARGGLAEGSDQRSGHARRGESDATAINGHDRIVGLPSSATATGTLFSGRSIRRYERPAAHVLRAAGRSRTATIDAVARARSARILSPVEEKTRTYEIGSARTEEPARRARGRHRDRQGCRPGGVDRTRCTR